MTFALAKVKHNNEKNTDNNTRQKIKIRIIRTIIILKMLKYSSQS